MARSGDDAPTRAREPHDLLIFPAGRHTPRKLADRGYQNERVIVFCRQRLQLARISPPPRRRVVVWGRAA